MGAFILNNFTKLRRIAINFTSVPHNFDAFLYTLFKNSQHTLKHIKYFVDLKSLHTFTFPSIVLPNVSTFHLCLRGTDNFDGINIIPSTVCPNLKECAFWNIHKTANLLEYIEQQFPKHFVYSPNISTLDRIPLKFSHLKLNQFTHRRYASSIKCLAL